MKRYLLIILFAIIGFSSISQSRWVLSGGTTYSTFDTNLMQAYGFEAYRQAYIDAGGTVSSEAKNSLRVGAYLSVIREMNISEKGILRAGVKYLTIGDAYFFTTPDVEYRSNYGSEDAKLKMRPRTDYIAIPVQYGSRLSDRMTIYAGLSPHINVNNIIRFNYYEGSGDDVDEKWEKFDNPVNARSMVLFASGGFLYYMGGSSVLEFNVNRSLSTIYDDANAISPIGDAGAWNFELGIGFALK